MLDDSLSSLPERAILAITFKVVSLCEGGVIPQDDGEKHALITAEVVST